MEAQESVEHAAWREANEELFPIAEGVLSSFEHVGNLPTLQCLEGSAIHYLLPIPYDVKLPDRFHKAQQSYLRDMMNGRRPQMPPCYFEKNRLVWVRLENLKRWQSRLRPEFLRDLQRLL